MPFIMVMECKGSPEKPESWAVGVIYAVANLDRQACGVPGLLNSDFTAFFGASMTAVGRRAAMIVHRLTI